MYNSGTLSANSPYNKNCSDLSKNEIIVFLKNLRSQIVDAFESFESHCKFIKKPWEYHSGGGGEISLLRGDIFEKAAVNWSAISGNKFPMSDGDGPFFATGISVITHMVNPMVPTVHMNLRYIETPQRHWFGGGYDLTPMGFFFEEDRDHFHQTAKLCLDQINETLYPIFSRAARDYFYIPHRKKERGVGGIFFDHYSTEKFENDLEMWQKIGHSFLNSYLPILKKRIPISFTEQDKKQQLEFRAHYAEFNLMYDRGTKFGFMSGGNPEAILCSMPPLAAW